MVFTKTYCYLTRYGGTVSPGEPGELYVRRKDGNRLFKQAGGNSLPFGKWTEDGGIKRDIVRIDKDGWSFLGSLVDLIKQNYRVAATR